jgi:hypothetical protein
MGADNFHMRSTMGYIIFINSHPTYRRSNVDKSKIQKFTCEVVYIALGKEITDTNAIEIILSELLFKNKIIGQFYTDNEAASLK